MSLDTSTLLVLSIINVWFIAPCLFGGQVVGVHCLQWKLSEADAIAWGIGLDIAVDFALDIVLGIV